jgi:hypothetical protein
MRQVLLRAVHIEQRILKSKREPKPAEPALNDLAWAAIKGGLQEQAGTSVLSIKAE